MNTEKYKEVRKEIEEYNKEDKPSVAINCSGIGDFYDYDILLTDSVYCLYIAGHREMALKMMNTSPCLLDLPLTMEDLDKYITRRNGFKLKSDNELLLAQLNATVGLLKKYKGLVVTGTV